MNTRVILREDGQGFAEPHIGALAGSSYTTCPDWMDEDEQISWQPLVAGTQPLPTAKCTPLAHPESTAMGAVKALSLARGTKSCLFSEKHHRWKCFSA